MQFNSSDRRLFQLFKIFVEKTFVPQIKNINGSLTQWNIFENMISSPHVNIVQLQNFIQNLPPNPPQKHEKLTFMKKIQQSEQNNKDALYMNKTFSGQRNKKALLHEQDPILCHKRESTRQDIVKSQKHQNNSIVISNLERLLKNLEQNQKNIELLALQCESSQIKCSRSVLHQISHNGPLSNGSLTSNNHGNGIILGQLSQNPSQVFARLNH